MPEPLVPTFGRRSPGAPTTVRPGAYALLLAPTAPERIAVLASAAGCFLPGGGVEPGETHAAAVVREVAEETGARCAVLAFVGRADEWVDAPDGALLKRGSYFVARATALGAPARPDHPDERVEWIEPARAAQLLSDGSQRWAVRRWLSRQDERGARSSALAD